MARHELVEALVNADELPIVAIGGCLLLMDEVAPDLLEVVESAAAGTLNRRLTTTSCSWPCTSSAADACSACTNH